jgi:hypothetical protein
LRHLEHDPIVRQLTDAPDDILDDDILAGDNCHQQLRPFLPGGRALNDVADAKDAVDNRDRKSRSSFV